MLSPRATAVVLVMQPSLNHLIDTYQKKVNYVVSFANNTRGINAEVIFDLLGDLLQRMEALKVLKNVLDTAYSMLNKRQKKVVTLVFFKGYSKLQAMEKLRMNRNVFENIYQFAVERIAKYVEILGFSENMLIANFDDEPLFIETGKEVKERFFTRNNGTDVN